MLNPLRKTRDQTFVLKDTSQIRFHWAMTGTPHVKWFYPKTKIEGCGKLLKVILLCLRWWCGWVWMQMSKPIKVNTLTVCRFWCIDYISIKLCFYLIVKCYYSWLFVILIKIQLKKEFNEFNGEQIAWRWTKPGRGDRKVISQRFLWAPKDEGSRRRWGTAAYTQVGTEAL